MRQRRVISRAAAGANIFLTGVAGTGKTAVSLAVLQLPADQLPGH